jgi:ankyrin repeat protein
MTELLEALYRGQQDRVRELLADKPELSVFEAAAFGRTERLRELLEKDPALANAFGDDGFQPLGLACFFGHVDAARLLLDHGADPNTLARNEHIQTSALHAAAASENKDPDTRYELCKMLLEHGADPNLRQGGGGRPIDAARMTGHEQLEGLLAERGAET